MIIIPGKVPIIVPTVNSGSGGSMNVPDYMIIPIVVVLGVIGVLCILFGISIARDVWKWGDGLDKVIAVLVGILFLAGSAACISFGWMLLSKVIGGS